MRTIAIVNPKGGVAKSTSTTNLACIAGATGKKVLLIDLDPVGTASRNLGVPADIPDAFTSAEMFLNEAMPSKLVLNTEYGIDLIPAGARQGEAETKLHSLSLGETLLNTLLVNDNELPAYDHIFIDTPASRSKMMTAALVAAQAAMVPMNASKAATDEGQAVIEIIDAISRYKTSMQQQAIRNLGFFFTAVDTRTNAARETIQEFRDRFQNAFPVADALIPRRTSVEEALIKRIPLFKYSPDSDAAQAYMALYDELLMEL